MRLLLNSTMHHCQWHVASLDLMLAQALSGHNMRSTSFHFIRRRLEGGIMLHSFPFVAFSHPSSLLSILPDPCFPHLRSSFPLCSTSSPFAFLFFNIYVFLLTFLLVHVSYRIFFISFHISPFFSPGRLPPPFLNIIACFSSISS